MFQWDAHDFALQEQNIETEIDQTSQATNIAFQTQIRNFDYLFLNGMHLISCTRTQHA